MRLRVGPRGWALVLGGSAVLMAGGMIYASTVRPLSPLENTLFQLWILASGLAGSYIFGRQAARAAAEEMVKPAARSAFRRVLGLYGSLSRLAERLQEVEQDSSGSRQLDVVAALVQEQLASVTDAMEDWRDLVPEDVAEVEERLRTRSAGLEY